MTDHTELLLEAAQSARQLPAGTYGFRPPLKLTDVPGLIGTPGSTFLIPLTKPAVGESAIVIRNTQPGDSTTGLPKQGLFRDWTLLESGWPASAAGAKEMNAHGVSIDGACLRFERIVLNGYRRSLNIQWGVDLCFRDSVFHSGVVCVYISKPPRDVTTTVRFDACQIRTARHTGMVIQYGEAIDISRSIIEGNHYCGLDVLPSARSVFLDRQTWFEANVLHLSDPAKRIVRERAQET